MSEICLKCFNEDSDNKLTEKDVILEYDLCEFCGEIQPCIIKFKEKGIINKIKGFIKRRYYE